KLKKLAGKVDELLGDNVNHDAFALNPTAHQQELRCHHDSVVRLEDLRPDDDIHDARLVFEGEKDDTLRSPRALSHQNESCHGHAPVFETLVAMLTARDDVQPRQTIAEESARMRLQLKAGGCIVFGNVLAEGRGRKDDGRLGEKIAALRAGQD